MYISLFSVRIRLMKLFMRYCAIIICLFVSPLCAAETIILTPPLEENGECTSDDQLICDGKDEIIVDRGITSGKRTYGIKGDREHGISSSGEIWWSSFPGNTGTYKVKLGATIEADGDAPYKFMINDNVVHRGKYPFKNNKKNCDDRTVHNTELNMKTHYIKKGDRISLWISSVYYCRIRGEYRGQYCRFWGIIFEPVVERSGKAGKLESEKVTS